MQYYSIYAAFARLAHWSIRFVTCQAVDRSRHVILVFLRRKLKLMWLTNDVTETLRHNRKSLFNRTLFYFFTVFYIINHSCPWQIYHLVTDLSGTKTKSFLTTNKLNYMTRFKDVRLNTIGLVFFHYVGAKHPSHLPPYICICCRFQ